MSLETPASARAMSERALKMDRTCERGSEVVGQAVRHHAHLRHQLLHPVHHGVQRAADAIEGVAARRDLRPRGQIARRDAFGDAGDRLRPAVHHPAEQEADGDAGGGHQGQGAGQGEQQRALELMLAGQVVADDEDRTAGRAPDRGVELYGAHCALGRGAAPDAGRQPLGQSEQIAGQGPSRGIEEAVDLARPALAHAALDVAGDLGDALAVRHVLQPDHLGQGVAPLAVAEDVLGAQADDQEGRHHHAQHHHHGEGHEGDRTQARRAQGSGVAHGSSDSR
jgi:hypothetical protein